MTALADLVCTRCTRAPATIACLDRRCTPAPAAKRAEVELPGPIMIEPGDVARIVGHPPGLELCPACGTEQRRLAPDRLAVHFAAREATRPCVASWPPPAKAVR